MFGKTQKEHKDFSDKAIKSAAMKGARSYMKKHLHDGSFSMDECLEAEINEIKNEYMKSEHRGRRLTLCKEDVSFITNSYKRLKDELVVLTEKTLLSLKKTAKVTAINSTTAKAIVSAALDNTGLPYQIFPQRYRLKVLIGLERKSVLLLHIHYKDISGKDIGGLCPALMALNDYVSPAKQTTKQ